MEKYTPEEVKELISILRKVNSKAKKSKGIEPTRLEKQIKYLEQRLNFFNPTKEMLGYIINQVSSHGISETVLKKLREEFASKKQK